MCGCKSTSQNRSVNQRQRNRSNKTKVWAEPLEFYQAIDTSSWAPNERAIVRSQISIYHLSGTLYHETIKNLLFHYSQ